MEKKLAYAGGDLIHHLPDPLLQDILSRLDPESLCSAAPACRLLRRFASQALASMATIDLSEFPPSAQVVDRVVGGNGVVRRLTLDCSLLDDSSVDVFVKEGLEELVLLKCSRFSSYVFSAIGDKCCNLSTRFLFRSHCGMRRRSGRPQGLKFAWCRPPIGCVKAQCRCGLSGSFLYICYSGA